MPISRYFCTAPIKVMAESAPILTNHKISFNAKGYISDGFILEVNGYSQVIKYNQHEDLNLLISYGDRDDTWSISAIGRYILEARPSYNQEFDIRPVGFQWYTLSQSSFFTYGVKIRYDHF